LAVSLLGLLTVIPSEGSGEEPEPEIVLAGKTLPSNEAGCMDALIDWLDSMQWSGEWRSDAGAQRAAYNQLIDISKVVSAVPWAALGVGQALLLYFWWRGEGLDLNTEAAQVSASMHMVSIGFVGCNDPKLHTELFEHHQCNWRWRHVSMILTEVGIWLAGRREQPRIALQVLQEAAAVEAVMQRLPFYQQHRQRQHHAGTSLAALPSHSFSYTLNTNSMFYPGPVNRPVWPPRSLPLARFLEAHADVFREDLEAILDDGRFNGLYWGGEVSMTQFAPQLNDWQMVSLVKNRKVVSRVCEHVPRSCELLAGRPEIFQCTAGDVGAAFARMSPGSGLRPHFWNAPRLGFHLGIKTPAGAKMHVGGQVVDWEEGRATVFDDTYVHGVVHDGVEPRYLLIGWFCHPCDVEGSIETTEHLEQLCPGRA
jgi:aspartate beta-hydroxylase